MSRLVPLDPNEPLEFEHRYFLAKDYPDGLRLRVAFAIANDLDACRDLLAGRKVDPVRLDAVRVRRARQAGFVQLVSPLSAAGFEVAA
jgi:hypothetical protein